ncbi:unknown [[Mannheimia] succiniciproducens MBEL55E]|uniref:Uncharacterized protein n=1 Tax=Mannheimia succiniciproducens (strain KCTC 0769BP / MBEL55E) TaxID=221988 RepID=Q65SZ3_MANSM|nr:unknown [[Mannheimia] succiniciproducens MBEL55E]
MRLSHHSCKNITDFALINAHCRYFSAEIVFQQKCGEIL